MTKEIFNYNNSNPVSISNGMVNATEMGKAFGKKPKDYLKTKSAKEYLLFLNQAPSINYALHVVNGGSHQGTWMCYELALDFAKWLSLEFHHWINLKTKEILTANSSMTFAEKLEEAAAKEKAKADLASKKLDHYVYIMGSNKEIKFGLSSNVNERLKAIRTGNPNVKLIYSSGKMTKNQAIELEQDLFIQFTDYKISGEWFSLTSNQVDTAKLLIKSKIAN